MNQFITSTNKANVSLIRNSIETIQINMGKLCNQACTHCHVEAGPNRTENMLLTTVQKIISLIENTPGIKTIDLTGGAPELNPHFRELVSFAHKKGIEVIDRCNLTILFEKNQDDLAHFLKENNVHIVASLPCYTEKNVDKQRGNGVFEKSIRGLQKLNKLGFGLGNPKLQLDLVYNPGGAFLPGDQKKLEADYKTKLAEDFNIKFDHLFTITNMPIKRFLDDLNRQNKLQEYMELLINSFNPIAAQNIMCKSLISIGHDGKIYDCDFNQMLELEVSSRKNIWEINSFQELNNLEIVTQNHCFGCTAGTGSSCTGALI